MKKILEVCCGSLTDVIHAVEGGAERIELCTALSVDGLTPSTGLTEQVRRMFPTLLLHVLIRPREGCFVYNEEEKEVILRDIRHAVAVGADAIVSGALTKEGDIDIPFVRRMIEDCGACPLTFHRAFDVCRDPLHALLVLKELGVGRILTSGQQLTAEEGIPLLRQLVRVAEGSPIIIPGGGVNSSNVQKIIRETGVHEIHGSCRNGTASTVTTEVAKILSLINF